MQLWQSQSAAASLQRVIRPQNTHQEFEGHNGKTDGDRGPVALEAIRQTAHRVPLPKPALAILRQMAELKDGSGLVFIGMKRDVTLSDMTLTAALRRMGRGDLTAHGFRSTFRDWAAETTDYPNFVVEQALAHSIGNAVEAAYRRGDLFAKRQALMADWAAFLDRAPAEVVDLPPGQRQAVNAGVDA
jgi:integrase